MTVAVMSMWTVYDHPCDWPEQYVARRYEILPDGPMPTEDTISSVDLALVRRALSLRGLTPITRSEGDDPNILETWL
jgi:hypothetical protein